MIDEHGAALSLYKSPAYTNLPLPTFGGNSSRKEGGPMSNNLKSTKLLYYFWLPAGKDEFGFQYQERAPLNKTASYRDYGHVEQTISKRLVEQAGKLKGTHSSLAGLTWAGNLEPTDAYLGLQKVQFEFRYERVRRSLDFMSSEPLRGSGMLLSNGLYLWIFDLYHDSKLSKNELQAASENFLKDDFIQNYIDKLFTFGWTVSQGGDLGLYPGVMTYYQLDMLFNGIFDYNALPHSFFGKRATRPVEDTYSIANIIKSISLASIQNSHRPLYETHSDFSLSEAYESTQQISTDVDLFDVYSERRERASAEKLLSRLSYAAMEQFLRVSISFGITHYKAGLDYCRAQLTDISLLARANQTTGDLSRPSLSQEEPRLADLESYYSVLAGKVPTLQFLQNLMEGLSKASKPLGCDSVSIDTIDDGWTEWKYSESTLNEALLQFTRQTEAIKSDLWTINQSLNVTRMDQVLSELTKTRKLTEIEAEVPQQIIIRHNPEESRKLDQRLGRIALVLAMMEVYGNFGVFLTQSFFAGSSFGQGSSLLYRVLGWAHWLIVIVVLILAYLLFMRRQDTKENSPSENSPSDDPAGQRVRSYIFDYSAIREKVNAVGGAEAAIRQLAGDLKAVDSVDDSVACVAITLSRDIPAAMGVERTKYTIESGESPSGISYILHIEIDRRWIDDKDEQLRDIRLVVRVPRDKDTKNFDKIISGSRGLVGQCMRSLILVGSKEGNVREFMQTRFGSPFS